MENEKSRIPVYSVQHPTVIGVLKAMRRAVKNAPLLSLAYHCYAREQQQANDAHPAYTFDPNPPACAVLRSTNQRSVKSKKEVVPSPLLKKTVTAAPVRNTGSKFRREAELRSKNKVLEITKSELSLKLTEMQNSVKNLEEQNDELEKENQKLKKFQESCMLILESRNCDPVTGNSILEEEEENKKRRSEIMFLTEELNAGLEQFNQMVKEQKDNLQDAQTKWKQIEDEHIHFLEQQQFFHREMEDLSALLDEEEKEALLN